MLWSSEENTGAAFAASGMRIDNFESANVSFSYELRVAICSVVAHLALQAVGTLVLYAWLTLSRSLSVELLEAPRA
jgi:hypothetical protein